VGEAAAFLATQPAGPGRNTMPHLLPTSAPARGAAPRSVTEAVALVPAAPGSTDRVTAANILARWARSRVTLVALKTDASALAPGAAAPATGRTVVTTAPLAVLLTSEPVTAAGSSTCRARARLVAMLPTGPRAIEEIAAAQSLSAAGRPKGAQITEPTATMAPVHLGDMNVVYDGDQLVLRTPALVRAGLSIAPLREIFERSDGVLYWKPVEKTVEGVTRAGTTIGLKIGDPQASLNGETKLLELAPFIKRGRTMVPVSFLAETLNVTIKYDPQNKRILITSKDN
jgi:hypothetical protein